MTEKIKLSVPVLVEGRYDKIAVLTVADATVVTTDGFGIFKNSEKKALVKRLSEKGLIVLCDSDGAGGVIRSHVSSLVPKERLYELYVPRIEGKEKRKRAPSKEGVLGVEGVPYEVLRGCFEALVLRHPELAGKEKAAGEEITKLDFYEAGLSGKEDSVSRRARLAEAAGLPASMTANALLAALNMLFTREDFLRLAEETDKKTGT